MTRDTTNLTKIAGELYPVYVEKHLAGTDVIHDYLYDKTQEKINGELYDELGQFNTSILDINNRISSTNERIDGIVISNECNIYNAKKSGELLEIISEIPELERVLGKMVTFIENGEWVTYQFIGNSTDDWNNELFWKILNDISQDFKFTASKELVKLTDEDGELITLTVTAPNDTTLYHVQVNVEDSPIATILNPGESFNIRRVPIRNDLTFEANAIMRGRNVSKTLKVDVAYPVFYGFTNNIEFIQQESEENEQNSQESEENEPQIVPYVNPEEPNANIFRHLNDIGYATTDGLIYIDSGALFVNNNSNSEFSYFVILVPSNCDIEADMNTIKIQMKESLNLITYDKLDINYKAYVSNEKYAYGITYNINVYNHG